MITAPTNSQDDIMATTNAKRGQPNCTNITIASTENEVSTTSPPTV